MRSVPLKQLTQRLDWKRFVPPLVLLALFLVLVVRLNQVEKVPLISRAVSYTHLTLPTNSLV